jgi:hypothetical protein
VNQDVRTAYRFQLANMKGKELLGVISADGRMTMK